MNLQDIRILVSLANQKGGVSKSTATTVIANSIHYRTGLDVCICDMDRQQSIFKARKEELVELKQNKLSKYNINNEDDLLAIRSYTGLKAMEDFREDYYNSLKDDYNIIFLDVPGSLDQTFIEAIGSVDLLLIPSNLTSDDIKSTMDVLDLIEEKIAPLHKKEIPKFFFPTKIDSRTSIAKKIDEFANVLPIPMLGAHLPHWPGVFGDIQTFTSYENLSDDKNKEKRKIVLDNIVNAFMDKVYLVLDIKN